MKKYIPILAVALYVLVSVVVIRHLSNKNKEQNLMLEAVNTEFTQYKLESIDAIAQYKKQVLVTESMLKQQIKDNDSLKALAKYYKQIAATITIKTEFVHDTIKVEVPRDVYVIDGVKVRKPIGDGCYSAIISVEDEQVLLYDLTIPNTQNIVLGSRKAGLFKSEYSFDVLNSNPCVVVTGMSSYKVTAKKRIYENPLFTGLVGFAAGVLVNQLK